MTGQVFVLEKVVITDQEILEAARLTDGEEEDVRRLLEMRDQACAVARPKYLMGVARITSRGEDFVELDGARMKGRLLAQNLSRADRVYPYLATCGTEAEAWSQTLTDVFEQYWADAIKLLLLGKATERMHAAARDIFPQRVSYMSPGSLKAWPLTAQRELFALIGSETLGITLTDSCLMLPHKSVSGIFFPSGSDFVNCRHCPIIDCPNRQVPFEKELVL